MSGNRLKGKTAIITGGANGFGAAMVKAMVSQGCRVVLTDLDDELGESLADSLGDACIYVHGDHCVDADNQRAVKAALDNWGSLDILINNAGIGFSGNFDSISNEELQKLLSINFVGQWKMTQAALSALRKSASANPSIGSVLLFTSSGLGLYGVTQSAPYTASKHAVIGLMRSLAAELGPENIRVNAICPGIADTKLARTTTAWGDVDEVLARLKSATPLGRLAEPEDIANAALFLASDEGRMVHSVALRVDGGAHT
jgi:3-oxoacyl-[acyl-carrier protein] reductase